MVHALTPGSRLLALVFPLAVTTGCVCPPCAGATTGGEAAGVPALASGTRLVVWDGDGNGIEGGKSWADCDTKPTCIASVTPTKGVGRDGSTGLVYRAKGPQWSGFGWNWFGWYPETAGTDISGYDRVRFWLKVQADKPELAPEAGSLSFTLGCSRDKKNSASATVSKYTDNLFDGEWHEVVIPLADLYIGKEGAEFDPGSAWEFRLSSWNPTLRDFSVIVDDVVFEKS